MSISSRLLPNRMKGFHRLRGRVLLELLVVVSVVAMTLFAAPGGPSARAGNPGAWVAVNPETDTVSGGGWVANSVVHVVIDDPTNGIGVDRSVGVTAGSAGTFSVEVGTGTLSIAPGFIVTAVQGTTVKIHTVTLLSDVSINAAADWAEGTGTTGMDVVAWVQGHAAGTSKSVHVLMGTLWNVDFNHVWNIEGGTAMSFKQVDVDGDWTQVDAVAPYDSDGDWFHDDIDNCPNTPNSTQYDGDGDGVGAACDDLDRVWGVNRYATSAAVAEAAFESADTVFIALGTKFPDALVAAAAGGYMDGPVLLTGSDVLCPAAVAEIGRLKPSTAYIVGGTAVISDAVEQEVKALVSTVKRLAGVNRYETSAAVSNEVFSEATRVVVALGSNFPDALVGAAAAAHLSGPVLLTPGDHAAQATLDELTRLHPGRIYLVGGTAAISNAVAVELAGYGTVVRLAGENRYETAAAVAAGIFPAADHVLLAYGGNFPDALVAAAAAGHLGGPVLLVTHDDIPDPTRDQLMRLAPDHIWLIGGRAVIGDEVFNLFM